MIFLDAATMGSTSLEPISALGELVLYPTSTMEEAKQRVVDADVILTNKAPVDAALMDCAPSLKLICGAALDVYGTEPVPEEHPLLHTSHPEHLRFTPHIGWASKEALERLVLRIAENIKMTDLSA